MTKETLSPLQQKFVNEILMDPDRNQKNAGLRAGMAPKYVKQETSKMIRLPKVAAAIREGEKNIQKETGITPARIMAELAKIGFANLQDYADLTEDGKSIRDISRDAAAAISEYNIESTEGRGVKTSKAKIKLSDKRAALVDMGKQIGMWKQQVEHTGVINFAKLVEDSLGPNEVIEGEVIEVEQITDETEE